MKRILSALIASPTFLVVVACGVVFFYRSGAVPFLGADEPRYARVSYEMLQTRDFVIPHLEGRTWLEKPPLLYWSISVVFYFLGQGEAQARLVSALSMTLMVVSVLYFGRKWFGDPTGWVAATILATTVAAAGFSRAASMDALFSALLFGGMCFLADAVLFSSAGRQWRVAASALCVGAAVLAKGLVGIILPLGVLTVFLVWTESWSRLSWRHISVWVATTLLVIVPWHVMAFQRAGYDFVSTYVVNHHLARFFTDLHHHSQPFYYYLAVVFLGFLPWSFLLPLALKTGGDKEIPGSPWRELVLLMRLWVVLIVGLFSLSSSKLPGYILPAFPAISLLVGVSLSQRRRPARVWLLGPALTVALVLATAAPVFLWYRYTIPIPMVLILAATLWILAFYSLKSTRSKTDVLQSYIYRVAGSFMVFMFLLLQLTAVEIGRFHSTRDVAARAMVEMQANDVLASYRFFHHTLGYYSNYRYEGNWESPEKLLERSGNLSQGTIFIVTEPHWVDEVRAVLKGTPHRVEVVESFGLRTLLRLTPTEAVK